MSVINKALSDMTEKKGSSAQPLEKVDVAPIQSNSKGIVIATAVVLTVGVGLFVWLNTAEPEQPKVAQAIEPVVAVQVQAEPKNSQAVTTVSLSSPLVEEPVQVKSVAKEIEQVEIETVDNEGTELSDESFEKGTAAVESKPLPLPPKSKPEVVAKKAVAQKPITQKSPPAKTVAPKAGLVKTVKTSTPVAAKSTASQQAVLESGSMQVVQVELTPQQLADKASARARKALDANDYSGAIKAYESALRYIPRDENIRKRVAALYYGRGDTRRAVRVLQQGIELDNDSQNLRLALVNILIKQDLPQAALGVIEHLPANPEIDYLAARAGLAQQIKRQDLALESYQLLTEQDSNNAKWWLGLAISQERSEQLDSAKVSYNKALNRVGLSNKTHEFIRSRLVVIQETKKVQNAD